MTVALWVVLVVVAFVIGGGIGCVITHDGVIAKMNKEFSENGRYFFVRCPVCGHQERCDTANLRGRLENEKPWIECGRCKASLIAPYMNHEVVRKARSEYQRLVIENKSMREILQEPHHPIRQEEEDELKKALAPPTPTAARGAMVVYSNGGTSPSPDDSR